MRRIRYHVACSLDGYIAGPHDEYDWIMEDPDIDFGEIFAEFDTAIMGRRTYETTLAAGGPPLPMQVFVFSNTMRPEDHPEVTVVSRGIRETLDELKAARGKDIWLFGGGELFRSLLELGYVDTVELAVVPILLGDGLRFLPRTDTRSRLRYAGQRVYSKSGIVMLRYDVEKGG